MTDTSEKLVQTIRRKTRKKHDPEEKIHIVLEGLRGEESVAELCRREGIAQSQYYSWRKEFLEADKKRLAGDTKHKTNSREVADLRKENAQLKQLTAEILLKNQVLKQSVPDSASTWDDE